MLRVEVKASPGLSAIDRIAIEKVASGLKTKIANAVGSADAARLHVTVSWSLGNVKIDVTGPREIVAKARAALR